MMQEKCDACDGVGLCKTDFGACKNCGGMGRLKVPVPITDDIDEDRPEKQKETPAD